MVLFDSRSNQDLLTLRAAGYVQRLANTGSTAAIIIPIGDERYGAMSGATVKTVGSEQLTGTLNSGNWNAMVTPLRSTPLIPVWNPDGSTDWIQFDDADYWSDTADGTSGNEPTYTMIAWVNMMNQTNASALFFKGRSSGGTDQDEWSTLITGFEGLSMETTDPNGVLGSIGRTTPTGLALGAKHIAFTKTNAVTSSSITIYENGVAIDDGDKESGTYIATDNSTKVMRFGAESDDAIPIKNPVAGAFCGPLFIAGTAMTADAIKRDYEMTRRSIPF